MLLSEMVHGNMMLLVEVINLEKKQPLACVGVARVLLLGLATTGFVVPPVVPPVDKYESHNVI